MRGTKKVEPEGQPLGSGGPAEAVLYVQKEGRAKAGPHDPEKSHCALARAVVTGFGAAVVGGTDARYATMSRMSSTVSFSSTGFMMSTYRPLRVPIFMSHSCRIM